MLGRPALRRIVPLTWKVHPGQVKPKVLKKRKIPREGRSIAELATHVTNVVREIQGSDPRRFRDAPPTRKPQWFPEESIDGYGFVGRRKELWEIHDAFQEIGGTLDRGAPVVSVRGVGGVGKSSLCHQYARWAAQDHSGGIFVIRLSGSDPQGRQDSVGVRARFRIAMRRIAAKLALPGLHGTDDESYEAIRRHLSGLPPYLWVVDDLPSIVSLSDHGYLLAPTSNGRTLLTTRGSARGRSRTEILLEGLGPRPGFTLLTARRKPACGDIGQRNSARDLVKELQGHPLALEIAAGLTSPATYGSLLHDLRKDGPDVMELAEHLRYDLPADTTRPLSSVLLRAFDALPPQALKVLAAASVLSSAPIPRELLVGVMPATDGSPHARLTTAAQGISVLKDRGLLNEFHDDSGLSYTMHALVGRATRVLLREDTRQTAHHNAVRMLEEMLSRTHAEGVDRREAFALLPHVLAVADLHALDGRGDGTPRWSLVNESGRLRSDLGDSAGAVEDFRALYSSCHASPVCDHFTRVRVLVGLGATLQEQGALTEARALQQESVEQLDAILGRDHFDYPHPDTLWAMNNLANTHTRLADHLAARALLSQVYRAWHGLRGPAAPETLTALNNLVIAIGRGPGRYAARVALRIGRSANERWNNTAGRDSRGSVDSLFSIGANHLRLGEPAAALKAFEEVWRRRRSHLGDDHPDTLDAQENIITARRSLPS